MNLSVMRDGSEQIHYQDPTIPIYLVYGNLRELSGMAALCHWHEDVELLMPIKGYLNYNVNGNQIHIAQGNAIFVNSRQMHYGFSADGTDCEYICLCFKPELLCVHRQLYQRYVMPLLTNSSFLWLILDAEKPDHNPLLNMIREIADRKVYDLALVGKLLELWQGIYALSEQKQTIPVDHNLDALRKMLALISTNYPERITLAQLAAAGGVCRSRCCKIFKDYIGHTPVGYLTSFRLERAMELLRSTDFTVTEIAFRCGFNSASYFTEIFSKSKGCSPREYRNRKL